MTSDSVTTVCGQLDRLIARHRRIRGECPTVVIMCLSIYNRLKNELRTKLKAGNYMYADDSYTEYSTVLGLKIYISVSPTGVLEVA